jgi:hypothetical protein
MFKAQGTWLKAQRRNVKRKWIWGSNLRLIFTAVVDQFSQIF